MSPGEDKVLLRVKGDPNRHFLISVISLNDNIGPISSKGSHANVGVMVRSSGIGGDHKIRKANGGLRGGWRGMGDSFR